MPRRPPKHDDLPLFDQIERREEGVSERAKERKSRQRDWAESMPLFPETEPTPKEPRAPGDLIYDGPMGGSSEPGGPGRSALHDDFEEDDFEDDHSEDDHFEEGDFQDDDFQDDAYEGGGVLEGQRALDGAHDIDEEAEVDEDEFDQEEGEEILDSEDALAYDLDAGGADDFADDTDFAGMQAGESFEDGYDHAQYEPTHHDQYVDSFASPDEFDAGTPHRAEAVRPARISSRVLGGLADLAVHAAVLGILVIGNYLLGVQPNLEQQWPPLLLFLMVFSFFYTVVPLAFWGQTPGMASVGLSARTLEGENLSFVQTTVRWLIAVLTLALLGLPLLLALSGRSLADRLSGSTTLEPGVPVR